MTAATAELTMRRELGDVDDRDTTAWSGTVLQHGTPKLAQAVMLLRDVLDGGARRHDESTGQVREAPNAYPTAALPAMNG